MDISVRELKAHLSEYLRRAQAGEEVVVTLRGRRIARLVGETTSREGRNAEAEAIARLDAQPWVTPPRREGKPQGASNPIPWQPGAPTAEDIVREMRD